MVVNLRFQKLSNEKSETVFQKAKYDNNLNDRIFENGKYKTKRHITSWQS